MPRRGQRHRWPRALLLQQHGRGPLRHALRRSPVHCHVQPLRPSAASAFITADPPTTRASTLPSAAHAAALVAGAIFSTPPAASSSEPALATAASRHTSADA